MVLKKIKQIYEEEWVMTGMLRKALLFASIIALLMMFASLALAGTTGKIKGRVIDKITGEPVLGASVMLVGTTQGAVTDADGKFMIQLVPPGEYVLKVTSISYTSAVTDADGKFMIQLVPPGEYVLKVTSISYTSRWRYSFDRPNHRAGCHA